MVSDPIADLLIQIKNGYLAYKKSVTLPSSNLKLSLANLLAKEGYVGKIEVQKKDKAKSDLIIELLYQNKKPSLTNVISISTPGRKIYVKKNAIPKVFGGLGITVVSTPFGLLTDKEARKKGTGGELICKLW